MTQPNLGRPNNGGYRRPRNPAPVSGPGRLSRRTDGGPANPQPARDLPNPDYGEQQTFRDIQGGAPMAAGGSAAGGPVDLSGITPLSAPSSRPEEPVTAGADSGPGVGMEALGLQTGASDPGVQYLRTWLPGLEMMSNSSQATQAFKMFVRQLRGSL